MYGCPQPFRRQCAATLGEAYSSPRVVSLRQWPPVRPPGPSSRRLAPAGLSAPLLAKMPEHKQTGDAFVDLDNEEEIHMHKDIIGDLWRDASHIRRMHQRLKRLKEPVAAVVEHNTFQTSVTSLGKPPPHLGRAVVFREARGVHDRALRQGERQGRRDCEPVALVRLAFATNGALG